MPGNRFQEMEAYLNGYDAKGAKDQYPEEVTKPEFASVDACLVCHHSLECMSGQIPDDLVKAHKHTGSAVKYFLPCINDGRVMVSPNRYAVGWGALKE